MINRNSNLKKNTSPPKFSKYDNRESSINNSNKNNDSINNSKKQNENTKEKSKKGYQEESFNNQYIKSRLKESSIDKPLVKNSNKNKNNQFNQPKYNNYQSNDKSEKDNESVEDAEILNFSDYKKNNIDKDIDSNEKYINLRKPKYAVQGSNLSVKKSIKYEDIHNKKKEQSIDKSTKLRQNLINNKSNQHINNNYTKIPNNKDQDKNNRVLSKDKNVKSSQKIIYSHGITHDKEVKQFNEADHYMIKPSEDGYDLVNLHSKKHSKNSNDQFDEVYNKKHSNVSNEYVDKVNSKKHSKISNEQFEEPKETIVSEKHSNISNERFDDSKKSSKLSRYIEESNYNLIDSKKHSKTSNGLKDHHSKRHSNISNEYIGDIRKQSNNSNEHIEKVISKKHSKISNEQVEESNSKKHSKVSNNDVILNPTKSNKKDEFDLLNKVSNNDQHDLLDLSNSNDSEPNEPKQTNNDATNQLNDPNDDDDECINENTKIQDKSSNLDYITNLLAKMNKKVVSKDELETIKHKFSNYLEINKLILTNHVYDGIKNNLKVLLDDQLISETITKQFLNYYLITKLMFKYFSFYFSMKEAKLIKSTDYDSKFKDLNQLLKSCEYDLNYELENYDKQHIFKKEIIKYNECFTTNTEPELDESLTKTIVNNSNLNLSNSQFEKLCYKLFQLIKIRLDNEIKILQYKHSLKGNKKPIKIIDIINKIEFDLEILLYQALHLIQLNIDNLDYYRLLIKDVYNYNSNFEDNQDIILKEREKLRNYYADTYEDQIIENPSILSNYIKEKIKENLTKINNNDETFVFKLTEYISSAEPPTDFIYGIILYGFEVYYIYGIKPTKDTDGKIVIANEIYTIDKYEVGMSVQEVYFVSFKISSSNNKIIVSGSVNESVFDGMVTDQRFSYLAKVYMFIEKGNENN